MEPSPPRSPTAIKPHWLEIAALTGEKRSAERLAAHFDIERALADRLRFAAPDQRAGLYPEVYDALFEAIADHPQRTRTDGQGDVERQLSLLKRLVPAGARFAEIGAGDARVSLGFASHCRTVTAIDVSDAVLASGTKPEGFAFVKIDGIHLPFEADSFDFVYSNQLMEHLHPEDGLRQLREIVRVLAPGGAYLCVTPNAASGPHDISQYFSEQACGFHLQEYSYRTLRQTFVATGLSRCRVVLRRGNSVSLLPPAAGIAIEAAIAAWRRLGKPRSPVLDRRLRALAGIMLLGFKPAR